MRRGVTLFLLVSLFASSSYSVSVDGLKKQLTNLDTQIDKKSTRIKSIDAEKLQIARQIADIEKDIATIEKDIRKTETEIKIVNRNISYGTSNLNLSSKVLNTKEMEYQAKLLLWSRKGELYLGLKDESIARRTYSNLLSGDLERIEYIKNVKEDITKVKANIESERRKLSNLKLKLSKNRRDIENKIREKNQLVAKLNNEKISHVKSISKMQQEKKRLEAQIEKIIRERAKSQKNVKLDTALQKLGKFLRPVDGRTVVRFQQKKQGEVTSNGIEIYARMGAPIKASKEGKVIYSGDFQGLNKVVMIDHGYNTIGVYGNLISTSVSLNQSVGKGQNIGILGLSSDQSPILYYEIRFNLKPINPELMF